VTKIAGMEVSDSSLDNAGKKDEESKDNE